MKRRQVLRELVRPLATHRSVGFAFSFLPLLVGVNFRAVFSAKYSLIVWELDSSVSPRFFSVRWLINLVACIFCDASLMRLLYQFYLSFFYPCWGNFNNLFARLVWLVFRDLIHKVSQLAHGCCHHFFKALARSAAFDVVIVTPSKVRKRTQRTEWGLTWF